MSNIAQQEIATSDRKNNIKVRSQKKITATKYLTYTAVFAALALIMKFIGQYLTLTQSFKITLIYTVWLIAGAVLGPLGGGAVGFISDVLGAIIFPTGAINPFLVLGNTFYGVLAALAFRFTPSRHYVVKFISAGLICTLVCTCLFNSLAIWSYYGYYKTLDFWQYFISFRWTQPLVALINIAVTVAMIPLLTRMRLLPAIKQKRHKKENNNAQHLG